VLAINTAEESDPVTKARAFKQQHALTYPILIDAQGVVRKAYAVYGFPTNLLIDREGTVRYAAAGFDSAALDRALQELTEKPWSPG
jgi:peroxiredoxin